MTLYHTQKERHGIQFDRNVMKSEKIAWRSNKMIIFMIIVENVVEKRNIQNDVTDVILHYFSPYLKNVTNFDSD